MEEKTRRISPRIKESLYERLVVIAQKENRSPTKQLECFIMDALDNYLVQREAKHA